MKAANKSKLFFAAIRSHGTAFSFIRKHGLWSYFIWPVLLSILVFWLGAELISSLSEKSIDALKGWIWDADQPDGFWQSVVYYSLWFSFKVLFVYTYYLLNKYLIFIFLSPVLAIISERVDTIATGKTFPFSLLQLYKDVLRGIAIALRNLFFEYLATVLLLLLTVFIPVLAPLYPFAVFFIAAYFYGFSFLDYNSERYRLSFKQSVSLIRSYWPVAVGIGTVFSLLFFVPIIGGIVAPILSCVAASLIYLKEMKQTAIEA